MQCVRPFTLVEQDNMIVPCGKCIACRIKKRQEWAMRMLHERESWQDSLFLTLTYSDEFVPVGQHGLLTLKKEHLQLFFKRLRHHLRIQYSLYNTSGRRRPLKRYFHFPLKYFACGEYGEETERPHYHAIIFGLSQFKDHRFVIQKCWPYADWTNRFIAVNSFGNAEADSIQYVSKYLNKKYSGDYGMSLYEDAGREPVFKLASNGIGREWCINHADQVEQNKFVSLNGVKLSLPRYYIDLLGLDISDLKAMSREKEELLMRSIIGHDCTLEEVYRYFTTEDLHTVYDTIYNGNVQREKNLDAKTKMFNSKKI